MVSTNRCASALEIRPSNEPLRRFKFHNQGEGLEVDVEVLVDSFNQEKAIVGVFSVIVKLQSL